MKAGDRSSFLPPPQSLGPECTTDHRIRFLGWVCYLPQSLRKALGAENMSQQNEVGRGNIGWKE